MLLNKMNTTVDGEFQRYTVESGAYIREHFFGPDPRLREMVEHLSDDELRWLPRGGHDYRKLYAAYKAATENLGSGAPTVILCKTIKGWTLGPEIEGRNATHQIKKMTGHAAAGAARPAVPRRTRSPTRRSKATMPPYYRPPAGLGRVPVHDGAPPRARRLAAPPGRAHPPAARAAGRRRRSPRCSAARATRPSRRRWPSPACCGTWPATSRSASASCRSSPTRPARSAWTRCSASSRSTPRRARSTSRSTTTCCSPTPSRPTARSSRRASPRPASTRQLHRRRHQLRHPRRADGALLHLLFDVRLPARRRPHLAGRRRPRPRASCSAPPPGARRCSARACSTRTATASCWPSTVPPCQAYDPAFAYEVATIVKHGIRRMYGPERRTTSSTTSPSTTRTTRCRRCPDGPASRRSIVQGLYRWQEAPEGPTKRATVLFSGSAQGAARQAAAELAEHYDVGVELWSATSYKALRDEALAVERWNRLHPGQSAAGAPRHPAAGRRAGPGRGRHRLHEDRARAGRPLRARPAVRPARHRRLRPLRHPRGAAPVLRGRRRPRRGGRAAPAWPSRARSRPRTVADAIARYGIDPDAPNPAAG